MTFAQPQILWLLLLALPMAIWVGWAERRKLREWIAYAKPGQRRREGGWAWLAAAGLLVLGAAGPRWGSLWGRDSTLGGDVVLVVDVSRSMAVEDAAPNRLAVAIESAKSLIRVMAERPGNRVGLVAFAGRATLRSPLTESLGGVLDALDDLRPACVKPGGTDIGRALATALDSFDDQPHPEGRTIVLLSDGEDQTENWRDQLTTLRDARVIVHTIAIGDPAVARPVPGPKRLGGVIEYDGKPVLSKRNDETLSALARETGGAFAPLGLAKADLARFIARRSSPRQVQRQRTTPEEKSDRYAVFVAAGLIVGILGSWPSRIRRRRAGLGRIKLAKPCSSCWSP